MGNFTEYAKKRNNQKASSGAFSDYVKRRNTGARTASSSLADNMKTNAAIQNAQMRAYNRGVVNNRITSGMMTEKTANTGENAYWDRMSKEDIIDTLRKHDTTPSAVRSGITGASAAVNNTDYNALYDKLYGDVNKLDDAETRKTVEQALSDKYRSEYAGMSTKDLEELLGTENREYETKQDRNYASALLEEMQFSEKYGSMSLEELEAEIQKSKLAGIQKNLQNNAVYSGTGKTNEQAKLEALYEQKKYDESHTNVYNSLTQKEKEMVVEVRNLRDKLRSYFGTAGDPVTMSQRKQRQEEKSELEKQISNIEEYFNEKGISVSDMEEYINRMANAEWMKGYNAELAEFSKEHPVLASMYSTAMNFASPVDAIMLLYNKIQGLPADPNTMIAANTRDTVRGAVSEDMSGFGQFLYSTGMSMADMATLLPLGKVGTLGMFFTSASTSTAKNVLERGGSTDNALKSGLAAGVAEVLFEKFSLDNLFKASSPSTIKQFVKGVLQQSGIEASEEVFTELSNEITDRWINGGLSEYEQNITTYRLMGMSEEQARLQASKDFGMKILEAGAGGALSGGVFGSVAQTGAFYNNTNRHFQEDMYAALEEKTKEEVINEIYEAMRDNEHETENDARNDVETAPNKQLVTTDEAMFDPQVKYFTEDGKLELQDGSNVNVEDVLFSDNTRTTLYQHASTEPSYILKNAFVANYRKDNSVSNETEEKLDILKYRTYYNQVKALTQNGRTLESITKEIGTKLDENTIKNIYTSVQNHMEYLAEKNVGKEQRVLVNKIAKSMGYEVRYTELPEANGMTRDGIIYISTSSENPALMVLAHEVTHNFKIQNPDKYQAYENYVIDYMKKYHPEEYKRTVRRLKALYKTNDMNAIHEEIACNMTEEFLINPDVIEKICKEDKTLAEKIVDFIKDLISKIEQLYKGYNPKSVEARVLKENLDTFNEALGLWMEAMGETHPKYSKKEQIEYGNQLIKYTEKHKDWWKNGRITIGETKNEIHEFIQKSKNKDYSKTLYYGIIGEDFLKVIEKETEIELKECNLALRSDEVRKIYKDHGDEYKEGLRGQRAVRENDLINIPQIIFEADEISADYLKGNNTPAITFKKKIGEECTIVTVYSGKHQELRIQTMYISNKKRNIATGVNEQAFTNTSETNSGTVSFDNSIPKDLSNDNRKNNEIKYSLKDDLETQVKEVLNNVNYSNTHVYLGATPENLIELGLEQRPMLMTSQHVYSTITDEATAKKQGRYSTKRNYHGMGKEKIIGLPDMIANAGMIIKSNTDANNADVVIVTNETDQNGDVIIVAIKPDGRGNYNQIEVDSNIIKSAYGKNNLKSYVEKAFKEDRILIFDKLKSQKLTNTPRVQFPNNIPVSDFTNNLTNYRKIVNSIIRKNMSDNAQVKKSLKDINPSIDLTREYEGVGFGEVSGILQNVTEKLKRTKIDPARIKRIADKLVKDCYSKYDSERLAKNLETMFTYLQNTRDLSWREFQMLTSEVMKPVIEQAEYVDKDVKELYDSFISFLRKNPISLASEQREDIQIQYGGMTQYKQLTSRKVVISKDGTSLADYDMWKKICEASGGYLTLDTKVIDRPAELEDAIRHMKPLPIETIGTTGMNMEQRAYDMTLTTLNYYMSAQKDIELRQAADKIEKIQKKKADAIKKSYEKRLKELGEQEAEYRKIIKSNERIKSDERVRRQKAHYEQIQENARERKRKTALRNKIRRLKEKLDKKLIKPTDGSHIPPTLVRSAVEFLDAINLDTGRGTALSEKTKQLKDQYEKFKKDPAFEMDSDERTYAQITHLYEIFDGRNITDLTEQELQWVYEVVDQLYHQIVSESRLIAAEYDKGVYEAAKEVNEVIKESKGATSAPGKFVDWYKIQHLNPINFFRYITGYKECVINDVISHINEAQHRQMKMEMEIEQIFKPVTQGKENQDELRRFVGEDEKDWVEVGGIKMPRSMRLSLVMHSLNDANIKHIVMGGITVPDWELLKKGDVKNAYREGNTVRFFAEELEKARKSESENAYDVLMWQAKKWLRDVSKDLTDYDRKFLECVKKYFHEYSGEKINETTLKLKGYKVAKTHNYFPIHTDTDFLQNEIDVIKFDASLNGSGFLKERRNASNPILLEDMIRLVENHKASTSRYCAFAIPVRDLQKVYNVSFNGWEGSVKKTIAQNWGGKANNYIENLIADIQGARKPKMEELDAVIAKFKNNYASAILTTNASVAISQISGYPLGAAVVGWKPIIKAMAKGGENGTPFGRAERELIDKYTPLLWYRDQGNSTQELGDLAKRNDITQKHQWLTNWLQKMDSATVGRQWYAAEYYVQDEFKNLQEGSDEYYIKVAEVFNEIVEKTQPNYTVMQSAALLRNPSSLWKALFMFKTQAMTNANMLLDTYGEWQATKTEKSRKAFFRALSAQIVSGLIYGATKAAYGLAFYRVSRYWDDEEDKVTLEEILAEIFKDLNSTFAGCFLLGEELYALIESLYTKETYYGPEVTFIAQISDSFSSVVNLRNVFEKYFDGDATIEDVWDKVKEVGFNTSTLSGIPVENAYKLVDGITNHAKDILNNEFFTFNESGKRSRYKIMYEAMLRGDKERFEEVREELISNSSASNVDSRIKKYLADNDIRIGMAAQAKAEGDFETFEETLAEMTDEGWNKEIVIGAINKAQDALKVEEPEEQKTEIAKVESIYTYSDVTTALENGYTYNAQKAITDLYNTALENGKEEDKARRTIKTQITKHFKEKYREGTQEERAQIYKYLSEIMIGKEKLYKNSDFKEWLKSDE